MSWTGDTIQPTGGRGVVFWGPWVQACACLWADHRVGVQDRCPQMPSKMQSRKDPRRVDSAMQGQVSEWTGGLSGQHLSVQWGWRRLAEPGLWAGQEAGEGCIRPLPRACSGSTLLLWGPSACLCPGRVLGAGGSGSWPAATATASFTHQRVAASPHVCLLGQLQGFLRATCGC